MYQFILTTYNINILAYVFIHLKIYPSPLLSYMSRVIILYNQVAVYIKSTCVYLASIIGIMKKFNVW